MKMTRVNRVLLSGAVLGVSAAALGFAAPSQDRYSRLRGDIQVDGSSTVFPITQAAAEEFRKLAPNVNITVAVSGTGGGFKRFAAGETDISDASRPIKASEYQAATDNDVNMVEVPVAYDGLTIVVNPSNTWVKELSVADLKKIFLDGSKVDSWDDLDSSYPNVPVKIYAPGTDSGTFDYFKEVVAEDSGAIRSDMSVSEDDNVLVKGVAGDKGAIGFFGVAYFEENKDQLRAVPIVNPESGVAVMPETDYIESGEYAPFSRPLFIYVNADSLNRTHVREFVNFYLENAAELSEKVGYVRLPESIYEKARARVRSRQTGTCYVNDAGKSVTGSLTEVYK